MPRFKYVATNDSGETVRGSISSSSPEAAEAELAGRHLFYITIKTDDKSPAHPVSNGHTAAVQAPAPPKPPKPAKAPKPTRAKAEPAPEGEAKKKSILKLEITKKRVPR